MIGREEMEIYLSQQAEDNDLFSTFRVVRCCFFKKVIILGTTNNIILYRKKLSRKETLTIFANFGQIRESYFREKLCKGWFATKSEKREIREIFQLFGLKLENIIKGII